jgi:hypothetical protein
MTLNVRRQSPAEEKSATLGIAMPSDVPGKPELSVSSSTPDLALA